MPAGDSTQRAWMIEATCHGVQIDFSHLQCVIKENNKYDKDAVAPMKDETIVGHVPAEHSKIFKIFIRREAVSLQL